MKTDCLEIGIIQSFLDGELANHEMTQVSTHVASCDSCAVMLAEAENEAAIVFPALARELDTLVPTQRLWSRINESIALEKQQTSVWEKAFAFFSTTFASPSITVAAGLLIVIGVFAMLMTNRSPEPTDLAEANPSPKFATPIFVETPTPSNGNQIAPEPPTTSVRSERASFRVDRADFRGSKMQPISVRTQPVTAVTPDYMPGEDSYVKTIANLTKTVDEQKAGGVLRPSQQVAYERDMAVVDDAISKMRAAIKRNPKNESAKQVLYSSYQNKIDLLNAVAQKEELIASR